MGAQRPGAALPRPRARLSVRTWSGGVLRLSKCQPPGAVSTSGALAVPMPTWERTGLSSPPLAEVREAGSPRQQCGAGADGP